MDPSNNDGLNFPKCCLYAYSANQLFSIQISSLKRSKTKNFLPYTSLKTLINKTLSKYHLVNLSTNIFDSIL